MLPDLISVSALPGHRLRLTFANGECRRFDMTPYLGYPVFRPLQNPGFFGLARIDYGTVTWPGDIDIAPETLYIEALPDDHEGDEVGATRAPSPVD